jgi:hypothetical protein
VRRVDTYAAASAWAYHCMLKGGAYKENSCSQVFSDMEASALVLGNGMAPFVSEDNHGAGQSLLAITAQFRWC